MRSWAQQGRGDQRLPAHRRDLNQPPVAQGPLRRQRLPGRVGEEGQGQGEGGIGPGRVVLGTGTQGGQDACPVPSRRRGAEYPARTPGEAQALPQQRQRGRRVALRGGGADLSRPILLICGIGIRSTARPLPPTPAGTGWAAPASRTRRRRSQASATCR